jgi:hypothetical protein
VRRLGEAGSEIEMSRVSVRVNTFAQAVTLVGAQEGQHQVHFMLDPALVAGAYPLVISIDGRDSLPLALPVR